MRLSLDVIKICKEKFEALRAHFIELFLRINRQNQSAPDNYANGITLSSPGIGSIPVTFLPCEFLPLALLT